MKARLAKRKPGFWERTKESWKSMKLWDAEELNKLDWVISAVILMFLFFTCAYGDLMLTGNRSFLMYEHFTDFYKASYEQSHGYYANYLPSTFLAYAIWNLPLYLTGHAPQAMLTNSFINNMWYKLLPVLLYYATSHLIYQIGVEVGFGEKKAKLCKFAFLVFPIGVFSQFIFSQYDIFTVFFMVLGLYFYVRGGLWKFCAVFRRCGNVQISRTAVFPGTAGPAGKKDPQSDQIRRGNGASADDRSAAEYRKYLL